MTRDQVIAALSAWQSAIGVTGAALQDLFDVVGCNPESPLVNAIHGTEAAYTDTLEQLIVGKNDIAWLDWYRFETRMGAEASAVSIHGVESEIQSIESLADLLLRERAEYFGQEAAAPTGDIPLSTTPQRFNTFTTRVPMTDDLGGGSQFDVVAGLMVERILDVPRPVEPPDSETLFPPLLPENGSVTLQVMHRGVALKVTVAIRLDVPPPDASSQS